MRSVAASCLLAACYCPQELDDLQPYGQRWREGDTLFHLDARWLGGDGAYSLDLGGDRSLWLFGDSFIATTPALTRGESTMVRNSVAVMRGQDPELATMQFAWRGTDDAPSSFFPEEGTHWFRPGDGARAPDGSLIVFLTEEPNAAWRAVRIPNTLDAPSAWSIEPVITQPAPYAADATVACSMIDGKYLVAVFVDGERHDGRLARWPLADLPRADLSSPEWWTGKKWVTESELTAPPKIVLPDGSTECSLASDGYGAYIHIQSRNSQLALRRSFEITGEYSKLHPMLLPPESLVPNAIVYGGKGHTHLGTIRRATDKGQYFYDLTVTFTNSTFTALDLLETQNEKTVFWPHFGLVLFSFPMCD